MEWDWDAVTPSTSVSSSVSRFARPTKKKQKYRNGHCWQRCVHNGVEVLGRMFRFRRSPFSGKEPNMNCVALHLTPRHLRPVDRLNGCTCKRTRDIRPAREQCPRSGNARAQRQSTNPVIGTREAPQFDHACHAHRPGAFLRLVYLLQNRAIVPLGQVKQSRALPEPDEVARDTRYEWKRGVHNLAPARHAANSKVPGSSG